MSNPILMLSLFPGPNIGILFLEPMVYHYSRSNEINLEQHQLRMLPCVLYVNRRFESAVTR
jgi:hypothetical protein